MNKLFKKINDQIYLFRNFGYLSTIQLINLIIPLIAYPYLIRILGVEIFGVVIFAQTVALFLLIIVSFGFNISATSEVSIHRMDKTKLIEIISSVYLIKGMLFLFSVLLLTVGILFVDFLNGYKVLFYLSLWICIYDIVLPVWYFQGIEDMGKITLLTFVNRIIFLILMIIFIKQESDYLWYPIINGIGTLVVGLISSYLIFFKEGLVIRIQSVSKLVHYFNDALPLFISEVAIKIYVSTNKLLIGAFIGMSGVAFYDLAEKIINVMKMPQKILTQTLFPMISKDKSIGIIKSILRYSIGVNIMLMLITLIFAKEIVLILGGSNMLDSVLILRVLAFSIPFIALSNIYGIQLLIPFGHRKTYAKIVLISSVVYLIGILCLWNFNILTIISITILTVCVEIIGAALMVLFTKRKINFKAFSING